jgi:hypothetical protein
MTDMGSTRYELSLIAESDRFSEGRNNSFTLPKSGSRSGLLRAAINGNDTLKAEKSSIAASKYDLFRETIRCHKVRFPNGDWIARCLHVP